MVAARAKVKGRFGAAAWLRAGTAADSPSRSRRGYPLAEGLGPGRENICFYMVFETRDAAETWRRRAAPRSGGGGGRRLAVPSFGLGPKAIDTCNAKARPRDQSTQA